jgi:hypothetical protein
VYYKDEGQGFYRAANRRSWNAVVEAFLAQHLGGRVEPVGDDFKGSSIIPCRPRADSQPRLRLDRAQNQVGQDRR